MCTGHSVHSVHTVHMHCVDHYGESKKNDMLGLVNKWNSAQERSTHVIVDFGKYFHPDGIFPTRALVVDCPILVEIVKSDENWRKPN